jgi:hypothetical protein
MRPKDALGRDVNICLTSRIADADNKKMQMTWWYDEGVTPSPYDYSLPF